jgi:hypothetical protein
MTKLFSQKNYDVSMMKNLIWQKFGGGGCSDCVCKGDAKGHQATAGFLLSP